MGMGMAAAAVLALSAAWVRAQNATPVSVVSLSKFTTELAQEIGGARVQIHTLGRSGSDPHQYEPTSADLAKIADAKLILALGLGMEPGLQRWQASTRSRARIVKIGDVFGNPLRRKGAGHTHSEKCAHGPAANSQQEENTSSGLEPQDPFGSASENTPDPHWWHSVPNMIAAVDVVRGALEAADPSGARQYQERAAAYQMRLHELDEWVRGMVETIPPDARRMVTSHDAFQYFAREYSLVIYPAWGVTSEDEPSAGEMARLVRLIKREKVRALFPETQGEARQLEALARETGARVGPALLTDAPGTGDATTYEGMMRANVRAIVIALGGKAEDPAKGN